MKINKVVSQYGILSAADNEIGTFLHMFEDHAGVEEAS